MCFACSQRKGKNLTRELKLGKEKWSNLETDYSSFSRIMVTGLSLIAGSLFYKSPTADEFLSTLQTNLALDRLIFLLLASLCMYNSSTTKNEHVEELKLQTPCPQYRNLLDPLVFSNLSYIGAGVFAAFNDGILRSLVYFSLAICSFNYHANYEQKAQDLTRDKAWALLALLCNFARAYDLFNEGFLFIPFVTAMCAVLSVLIFRQLTNSYNLDNRYLILHSLWHLVTGFGTGFLYIVKL
eukprot:snap_masked-scaffold_1-processed-gene-31.3-mRNA-1 protein AED:1.00 eAED:1.00 QI:0/-1/0/0/-1/1/1/0/239